LKGRRQAYFDIIVTKALNKYYNFVDHVRNGSGGICFSSNIWVGSKGSVRSHQYLAKDIFQQGSYTTFEDEETAGVMLSDPVSVNTVTAL
jgi:hypothetical protein